MNKKAVVEVQFNWIYIGVIGVVILLFFVNIISGIRQSSQKQLEIDSINILDEILTGLQSSERTQSPIELSGLELEVSTTRDNCFFYTFSGSDLEGRSTEFLPLFSPHTIKTKILSYGLSWNVPFKVNNFLYMTSPEVSYVFVGEDYENEHLYEEMPDDLTKFLISINEEFNFRNENYYKIRFISNSKDPSLFTLHTSVIRANDEDVTAILIEDGEIIFYEKQGNMFVEKDRTYYLDTATLIAAVYSENSGTYECNLDEKAFKRLNRLTDVLKKRVNIIRNSNLPSLCDLQYYNQAFSLLNDLEEYTSVRGDITKEKINNIADASTELNVINERLNEKACPTIY